MFLAAKEMHRGKVKFALLLIAVSLLVFLILVQQAPWRIRPRSPIPGASASSR